MLRPETQKLPIPSGVSPLTFGRRELGFKSKSGLVTDCVSLNKFLDFSVPLFSHPQNGGGNNNSCLIGLLQEFYTLDICKVPTECLAHGSCYINVNYCCYLTLG